MTSVLTALSTSLDGFIAGADDSPKQPLGVGGERLFAWLSPGSARPSPAVGPTTCPRPGVAAARCPASPCSW